jgi:cytochrome c oxidase subunit 2
MEIHRFEALWTAAALALIVLFIGTVAYGAVGAGVTMVEDDGGTIDAEAVAAGEYGAFDNFREPGVYRTGENEYDVYIVAKQFLFDPGTSEPIRVPADSHVTFHVTSSDVTHGFTLVGTNVNTMVIPGQVARISVRVEDPAEYGIVCHEYCGAAHHEMAGNMTVVPRDEFDPGASLMTPEAADESDGSGTPDSGSREGGA